MKVEVDSVLNISTSLKGKFFKQWLKFLLPYHNLTDREMDVAAALLEKRYELSKLITDEKILDSVVMSEETKSDIRQNINIKQQHFQVIMSKLRKSKIIINNKLNPRFIPRIKEENNDFKLLLFFSFDNEKGV